MTEEEHRLLQARAGTGCWKRWGPYLAERAWGTVREDYSPDGAAWDYFPHDHARSRVYRWNEDGLGGICDDRQILCFALALWNGKDPILKERLFGLTGSEGNHGEDVKEYYYYLDSTPTHSYMRFLYKYPQGEFPYDRLVEENRRRGKDQPEYELLDTGVFAEDRYWDVTVEYAKAEPEEILIRITAENRGPEAATLHLLPSLWFRNDWSWGYDSPRPSLYADPLATRHLGATIIAEHPDLGRRFLTAEAVGTGPELLFTENETNCARLFPPEGRNPTPFVKDAFHQRVIHNGTDAVNPARTGTKSAAWYALEVPAGGSVCVRLRLTEQEADSEPFQDTFDNVVARRRAEADRFFAAVAGPDLSEEQALIQRQALAGLLWSKQYYHYSVRHWLMGDPSQPEPPASRWQGRNRNWMHLACSDVLSMPDKWEYPWFAAWDLAFHTVSLSLVDGDFAKEQLLLLLREWYMHPNGQLPAYEWAFGDVNPPVHAWAARRIYQIDRRRTGVGDSQFLERVFQKLLMNFTWWVNRKDREDRNIFQGGFLGLDNIGVFDRSAPLPFIGYLDQSDGTGWMAMFCLNMLAIALELASLDPTYEDLAAKFLEHFFYIAHAMNDRAAARGDDGIDLWDEEDGFYYDVLHFGDGRHCFLRLRSIVGLIPLLAVETLDEDLLERLPLFKSRLEWFVKNRPDMIQDLSPVTRVGSTKRRLLSAVSPARLRCILTRMLDEREFLSPYGIRSLSRHYLDQPFEFQLNGSSFTVRYEPAESTTSLFGGNSNWRGPVWFPLNYLLIEALQKFDYYFGEEFKISVPIDGGTPTTLWGVTTELSRRLIRIFTRDERGRRPCFGGTELFQTDPHWRDLLLFHEYFHGDNGAGIGASHQTGWTALVAKLIQQSGE